VVIGGSKEDPVAAAMESEPPLTVMGHPPIAVARESDDSLQLIGVEIKDRESVLADLEVAAVSEVEVDEGQGGLATVAGEKEAAVEGEAEPGCGRITQINTLSGTLIFQ
jgi:hypothetical protein